MPEIFSWYFEPVSPSAPHGQLSTAHIRVIGSILPITIKGPITVSSADAGTRKCYLPDGVHLGYVEYDSVVECTASRSDCQDARLRDKTGCSWHVDTNYRVREQAESTWFLIFGAIENKWHGHERPGVRAELVGLALAMMPNGIMYHRLGIVRAEWNKSDAILKFEKRCRLILV
jgi:hypothetical protein